MAEGRKPASLEDLDERLKAARKNRNGTGKGESDKPGQVGQQGGLGIALRIGVDLVAAVIVGVGIGFLLDYWLDTKPWFMLLFFVLGSAAGILNVFRMAAGYDLAAGYKKPDDTNEVDGPKGKD